MTADLRAQLDDKERRTRELLGHAQATILALKNPQLLGRLIPGWHDWPDVVAMCRERLAELAAMRRTLDLVDADDIPHGGYGDGANDVVGTLFPDPG